MLMEVSGPRRAKVQLHPQQALVWGEKHGTFTPWTCYEQTDHQARSRGCWARALCGERLDSGVLAGGRCDPAEVHGAYNRSWWGLSLRKLFRKQLLCSPFQFIFMSHEKLLPVWSG